MNIMDIMKNKGQEKDNHAVAPIPERFKKHERVLIITADNTEDIEFFYPYYRLTEAGYTVDVATPDGGRFAGKHGLGLSNSFAITALLPSNYALLYIPGGKAPAQLRSNEDVVNFVREFARTGKPIAAICHGPQLLAAAGLIKGRQIAAWPEIVGEIKEAGAVFVDEALVEDGQFITARKPGDLHRHLAGVLDYMEGRVRQQPRDERKASVTKTSAA